MQLAVCMSKRRKLWIGLVAVIAVIGIVTVAFWPAETEPEYQGKKLSEWLSRFKDSGTIEAIHTIDTNCLPILVRWIDYDYESPSWGDKLMRISRRLGPKVSDWVYQKTTWKLSR